MILRAAFGLALAASLLPRLAHADSDYSMETLVEPAQNWAVQRAQQRLVAAHALVEGSLGADEVPVVGFVAQGTALPAPRFRNAQVVYRKNSDGSKQHAGYLFEMSTSTDRHAPWAIIVAGRHGVIENQLFSGKDAVFALAAPSLPEGTLARALDADLSSRRPLDTKSAWLARRQARLGGLKPLVLPAQKR